MKTFVVGLGYGTLYIDAEKYDIDQEGYLHFWGEDTPAIASFKTWIYVKEIAEKLVCTCVDAGHACSICQGEN